MTRLLLSAAWIAISPGAAAGQMWLLPAQVTDMAPINPNSPDTNLYVPYASTYCNAPVLLYRFDLSPVIAECGSYASRWWGLLELQCFWAERLDWEFKAIATHTDFDQETVTWNSYTDGAADMDYWDTMTPEDTQAYPEYGSFASHGYWDISSDTIQQWIDGGGIATIALVRADRYYNTCHWTHESWNTAACPGLSVGPAEPASMALLVLGMLPLLRRRK